MAEDGSEQPPLLYEGSSQIWKPRPSSIHFGASSSFRSLLAGPSALGRGAVATASSPYGMLGVFPVADLGSYQALLQNVSWAAPSIAVDGDCTQDGFSAGDFNCRADFDDFGYQSSDSSMYDANSDDEWRCNVDTDIEGSDVADLTVLESPSLAVGENNTNVPTPSCPAASVEQCACLTGNPFMHVLTEVPTEVTGTWKRSRGRAHKRRGLKKPDAPKRILRRCSPSSESSDGYVSGNLVDLPCSTLRKQTSAKGKEKVIEQPTKSQPPLQHICSLHNQVAQIDERIAMLVDDLEKEKANKKAVQRALAEATKKASKK